MAELFQISIRRMLCAVECLCVAASFGAEGLRAPNPLAFLGAIWLGSMAMGAAMWAISRQAWWGFFGAFVAMPCYALLLDQFHRPHFFH